MIMDILRAAWCIDSETGEEYLIDPSEITNG